MEITRNVILDLLPIYAADEVSADTRALVEEYLEGDPELANVANRLAAMELSGEVPIPLTEEDKIEAYREAKQHMLRRNIVWAGLIAFVILTVMGVLWLSFFVYSSGSP
ncbi:MAG: hypothetical protein GTO14_03885 [Anaerolineales bacterium]|nr:hypothetical protein [Anaerolineales bacterium]